MTAALLAALFFTVALLVTTAYFLLGSVPLLVLSHDTPMDSRFVRGFFNTYYLAVMYIAGATAVSYVAAGRPAVAAGAAGLVILAIAMRRKIVAKMDALRTQIDAGAGAVIASFRRLHLMAILVNLAQLVLIVWSLIAASMQARAGA
jgi:hypothetical protein